MVKIISAADSPIPNTPLMLVTNEYSGTVTIFKLPLGEFSFEVCEALQPQAVVMMGNLKLGAVTSH